MRAYGRLENLQGGVITKLLGEGFFNGRPAIILSEVVGTPLHRLARDNTVEVDEKALQSGLVEALRALFSSDAKYWDQRLDNFLFCEDKERGQGKVMIVDLEQVTFPDQSFSWEDSTRTWEESMNFGTAYSLTRTFCKTRQSATLSGWSSGCFSQQKDERTGEELEQIIPVGDTRNHTEAPSYVLV